jgi:hypothetical protein
MNAGVQRHRWAMALVLAAAAVAAAAGEPAWDWLPRCADDDRICEIRLASPKGWTARPAAGLEARREAGQLVLRFEPRLVPKITVDGPQDRLLSVSLVAPGQGAGLAADADGTLQLAGSTAIIAVPRREAAADRRWGMLRAFEHARIDRCAHVLAEPETAALGVPALTRQIAAAQRLDPRGGGVIVLLSGEDRFAAWKHREYRQALAWLVADLAARGATQVVLFEPSCPHVDEPLLAPLRAQVRDVARAYRCNAIDTTPLGDHACWETAPGVLGQTLNAAGRTRRDQLLAVWLPSGGG